MGRVRFQFHLSTAIVLMFVAGGLIWANLVWRPGPTDTALALRQGEHSFTEVESEERRFPCPIEIRAVDPVERERGSYHTRIEAAYRLNKLSNIVCCGLILVVIGFLLEYLTTSPKTPRPERDEPAGSTGGGRAD